MDEYYTIDECLDKIFEEGILKININMETSEETIYSHKGSNTLYQAKRNKKLKESIIYNTSNLDNDADCGERIYNLLYERPVCKNCESLTPFDNFNKGYYNFCSRDCRNEYKRESKKAWND